MLLNAWNKKNNQFFLSRIIGCQVPSKQALDYRSAFNIWMKGRTVNGHVQFIHCIELDINQIFFFQQNNQTPFAPINLVYVSDKPLFQIANIEILNWLIQYAFFKNSINSAKRSQEFIIFNYAWSSQQEKEQVCNFVFKKFYTSQLFDVQFCDKLTIQKWFNSDLSKYQQKLIDHFKQVLYCVLGENQHSVEYFQTPTLFDQLLLLADLFAKNKKTITDSITFLKTKQLIDIVYVANEQQLSNTTKIVSGYDWKVTFKVHSRFIKTNKEKILVYGSTQEFQTWNNKNKVLAPDLPIVDLPFFSWSAWKKWLKMLHQPTITKVVWCSKDVTYSSEEFHRLLFLLGAIQNSSVNNLWILLSQSADKYFPSEIWNEIQKIKEVLSNCQINFIQLINK